MHSISSPLSLSFSERHKSYIDRQTNIFSASFWHDLLVIYMFMGFSCEDNFEEKEREFSLISETSATTQNSIIMEVYHHHQGVDNTDFFPVEHPMEPPDEDRPVKCPMPESSVISDERMHEKRNAESIRKRGEISGSGQRTAALDTEAPARGVRKRHHTLTHGSAGDIVMTPLMRMPRLPPLQSQNITIFQVLQQLDKFES